MTFATKSQLGEPAEPAEPDWNRAKVALGLSAPGTGLIQVVL